MQTATPKTLTVLGFVLNKATGNYERVTGDVTITVQLCSDRAIVFYSLFGEMGAAWDVIGEERLLAELALANKNFARLVGYVPMSFTKTPAQDYAARHNGSLHGYKPTKKTRRQGRNAYRDGVRTARAAAINATWNERNERIQYSHAAGEACQDIKLPSYGELVQVYVRSAAVLKAMLANHSWPARRIIAELFNRFAEPVPKQYKKPGEYRRAHIVAIRYFRQFAC